MLEHPFLNRLNTLSSQRHNSLCIGLDPDMDKMPDFIDRSISGVEIFLKSIIDRTQDICIAYKPNISFFEGLGLEGLHLLKRVIDYIDDVPVILDAKRGDIGNTSKQQARFIFEEMNADATTLHPYMGDDSLQPFFEYKEKFSFVLGLTSNPGSERFEKLKLETRKYLYEHVIEQCADWHSIYGNVGVVVGATQSELSAIRAIDERLLFLIPGVGAQGGSYSDCVNVGKNSDGLVLINMSRNVLYAGHDEDFALKARESASLSIQ